VCVDCVVLCIVCVDCFVLCIVCVDCVVLCIVCVDCVVLNIVCVDCVVLCTVCVYMCTVLQPPGGYLIAINKYIISYHIISSWFFITRT
jgi:hypothetical protein